MLENNSFNFYKKKLLIIASTGLSFSVFALLWNIFMYLPDIYKNIESIPGINYYWNTYSSNIFLFSWFNFLQYFTTQTNLIIMVTFIVLIIFYFKKKDDVFNITILKYVTTYISVTFTIFTLLLLPSFLIGSKDLIQEYNLHAYLPETICYHVICPVTIIVYYVCFIHANKNKYNYYKQTKKYYIVGMIYPCIYMLYMIFINFVPLFGTYHSIYGTVSNFNPNFLYTNVEYINAKFEYGSYLHLIFLIIGFLLFLFLLWMYNRIEKIYSLNNKNLNLNQ